MYGRSATTPVRQSSAELLSAKLVSLQNDFGVDSYHGLHVIAGQVAASIQSSRRRASGWPPGADAGGRPHAGRLVDPARPAPVRPVLRHGWRLHAALGTAGVVDILPRFDLRWFAGGARGLFISFYFAAYFMLFYFLMYSIYLRQGHRCIARSVDANEPYGEPPLAEHVAKQADLSPSKALHAGVPLHSRLQSV